MHKRVRVLGPFPTQDLQLCREGGVHGWAEVRVLSEVLRGRTHYFRSPHASFDLGRPWLMPESMDNRAVHSRETPLSIRAGRARSPNLGSRACLSGDSTSERRWAHPSAGLVFR